MKCVSEHGVYTRIPDRGTHLIVCLYVDDMLVSGDNDDEIVEFKSKMMKEFEMSDLGCLSYFLGTKFVKIGSGIFLHQTKWHGKLLEELKLGNNFVMKLNIDNKSVIDLAKYPLSHGRRKQIETKYQFLRDQVNKEKLELECCKSVDQLTNLLTKPLAASKFMELRNKIGMKFIDDLN